MTIASLIVFVLMLCLVAFLALYVTYLFVHRLRRGQSAFKTFARWLLDLFDIASGAG